MPDILSSFIELTHFGIIGYLISALFAYFTYSSIIYPYYLGPLRNIPRGKNVFWHYITYMYDYITGDPAKHLKLTQKYGPVVHVRNNLVVVSDASVRQYYMSYKFPKSKIYTLFNINGPNIFSTLNKDFHVKMKKLISPAFNNKALAAMESSIYKTGSESLVKYLDSYLDNEPNREFDFYHLFNCNTFDAITKMVFGTDFNTTWDEKKGYYYRDLLKKSLNMLFYRILIPFFNHVELPIETVFKPIILENIHKRRESNETHDDILQSMIDAEDPDTGAKLTDLQIVNECYILLLAGMDTTANTLTWTLYELLKHPKSLELVTTEIINNFPNLSEPITINDAKKKLKYLEAALLEALRMHPGAGGSISRVVPEGGVTICGHYIPPKTWIAVDIYAENNDPSFWENPREFNLDRWLGENREANKAKSIPFGLGNRSCIGRDLAWYELYMILADLIRHFDFELVDEVLTPAYKLVYRPKEQTFRIKVSRKSY